MKSREKGKLELKPCRERGRKSQMCYTEVNFCLEMKKRIEKNFQVSVFG